MNIIETNLSFGAMTVRSRTNRIICHHAAAKTCGAATIHSWHKANGWAGIGYHYVVRKNGTVERGRRNMSAHMLLEVIRTVSVSALREISIRKAWE